MIKLSIVVLAYKSEFLSQTLSSIFSQTNTEFKLFVFNDNSPDPRVDEIIGGFMTNKHFYYEKFSSNFGKNDLVAHWNRCVLKMTSDYIWLVCDDDIIPHDAVARFYEFTAHCKNQDLLRFNLAVVDRSGNLLYEAPPHPHSESSYDFTMRRLKRICTSSLSEYIFSRSAFELSGGFVNFPLAWASDDATWIKFGMFKNIKTIPGLPVKWRNDGQNISSDVESNASENKIKASRLFVVFAKAFLKIPNFYLIDWLKYQYRLVGRNVSTFYICYTFLSFDLLRYYLKFRNERKNTYTSIPVGEY